MIQTNREMIEELARLSKGMNIPLDAIADMIPSDISEEINKSNISETFMFEVFKNIMPGLERAIVILRSQDYTYSEIAWILGMKTQEISRVLYKVKTRLVKIGYSGLEIKGVKEK
jgi:DNA-directed RNA polymerase specialized sigma24 family protein